MREKGKHPKRTDIQALRALAVASVVIYHLWPGRLTGGFMGVDIFFVISGYLMTLTLVRDMGPVLEGKRKLRATATFLSNFYARRIKRLIPAAAVTLVATLGLVIATGQLNLIKETSEQIVASTLFVQNWFLANNAVDYLAASEAPTAVQHFWSLSLEEQFYLVWPLLLLSICLVTTSLFVLYKKHKIPGAVLPIALLIGAFFIYGYLLTKSDPAQAYFVTPARVWELIIGGILVFLPKLKNYDLRLLLPWLGLALCAYALYKLDGVNFPGWHALLPTIGTALIIYAGGVAAESRLSFTNIFKARPIQWLGNLSYSLYLWHWPLIVLAPILLTIDIDGPRGTLIKLGILLVSLGIAWLSFRYIELPTQKINLRKYQVYLLFVLVVGGIAGAAAYTAHAADTAAKAGLSTLHETATNKSNSCFGARSINTKSCESSFNNKNTEWVQYVEADQSLSIIQDGQRWCDYYRIGEQDDPTKYCEYGDTSSKKSIVVWGDSHADHWANALDDIGRREHIKFIHFSSADCATINVNKSTCKDRISFIEDTGILDGAQSILLSFWMNENPQKGPAILEYFKKTTDTPVYLIQDVPEAGTQGGPGCIQKGQACTNSKEGALAKVDSTLLYLTSSNQIKQDRIIPTSDMFCDESLCYSFVGGVSVYRDVAPTGNSHVSSVYSISLSELLEKRLVKAGAL